jgi:small subunit ribosomal protein S8e
MKQGRKITGGKYHARRKKRLHERAGQERHIILGETKRKQLRVRGGHMKVILLKSNTANVLVDGKVKKAEIKNVEETPQNKFFARQNRLVKSALIETSLGKARITNRPSQEGQVNAVLIKELAK